MDAIISHGCFLNECNILHSIVGVRSRLETGVELEVSYAYVESAYVESLLCLQFGAYKILEPIRDVDIHSHVSRQF